MEPIPPTFVGTFTSATGLVVEVWAKTSIEIFVTPSIPPSDRGWFTEDVLPAAIRILNSRPLDRRFGGWHEGPEP